MTAIYYPSFLFKQKPRLSPGLPYFLPNNFLKITVTIKLTAVPTAAKTAVRIRSSTVLLLVAYHQYVFSFRFRLVGDHRVHE